MSKMSYSERYGKFYKPGTLHPRKKVVFSEDALSSAEEAFADAVRHWDSIDWSKKTAREASVERNKLFRVYMDLQKLAMSPGGPSPSGTTPGGYLHGFWSQYSMRGNDPRFHATGVIVGAKGSPARERQSALAKSRKSELAEGANVPARRRLASQIAHLVMYEHNVSPHDLVRAYRLTNEEAQEALRGKSAFFGPGGKSIAQYQKHVERALRKKEWFSAPDPKAIPGAAWLYGRYAWLIQRGGQGDSPAANHIQSQLTNIGFNGWGLIIDAWPEAKKFYGSGSPPFQGETSAAKHESGRNPMIYTIRNANKKVVAKIVEGKPGEKIRVTSYDDLGRAYTHNEKSLFDAAAHVGGRGATVSGGWEDLEPSSRLLLQRWSAAKHESGQNPLTLGERAKMRLGVLSPAAARSANSREKDLFRSHTGEIQRLAESVEACRRCEHGAEKRALKQLALARKTLEGLTKLAKYRSDPDVAEASLKAFRRQIAAAEGVLTGKKPAAIVKRDPKAGRGRHSKFGEYEEAQVHESENNPRVSRTHPRRREVAVFKAHSSSRATAVAAKLRKAGHDSAVIGGYGGRTVVIDTPTRGTKGGSLSAADAALRAKIRALVGKR